MRGGLFLRMSQMGGTLPAPLFLFLAGFSVALVTDKLRQKGVSANEIARTTIRRGGEIFVLALLFRLYNFLLGIPVAPWTDLLRVDVLNVIGISIVLLGIACRISAIGSSGDPEKLRRSSAVTAVLCAAAIAMLTPPLWTTWRPSFLPWWVETYIDGVHTFGTPQSWLFPIFPWTAFAFAGLAAGMLLLAPGRAEMRLQRWRWRDWRARAASSPAFGLIGEACSFTACMISGGPAPTFS